MSPETLALLRSNRALQAAAGLALVLALAGIAKLVGSHSTKPVITSKTTAAAPVAPAKPPAGLALGPNETLVVPAEKPTGPLMPHYTTPQPPSAADVVPDHPQPAAVIAEGQAALAAEREPIQAERLAPLAPPPPAPAPMPPSPAPRSAPLPQPASVAQAAAPSAAMPRAYCPRCGEVIGLTVWPNLTEVLVRFQDGSTHAMRGPAPSRWRVGDRVRAEGGRLVAD